MSKALLLLVESRKKSGRIPALFLLISAATCVWAHPAEYGSAQAQQAQLVADCAAVTRDHSENEAGITTNSRVAKLLDELRKGNVDGALSSAVELQYIRGLDARERKCWDEVVAAIEAQKNEVANRPNEQLKTVYGNYIAMQACYESRKEYRVPYVTQQELNAARTITKRREQSLLQRVPVLAKQKDVLWEQAKKEYGKSLLATTLGLSGTSHNNHVAQTCRLVAMGYTADPDNQQQKIKKDF